MQTVVSFGTVVAGGVSQKTFTVFNGGGAALSLSNLSVPAGYTVVSGGFCTTQVSLPPGGSTQFVLGANTSALGTFTGTVTFSTTDGSVNPFSFPVTATVIDVAPTAVISNSGPVTQGSPVTVSLSNPCDPSSADTAAGFRYSFALTEAALSKTYATTCTTPSATYTFAAAGTYTAWGRILDVNGLYTDYSTQVDGQRPADGDREGRGPRISRRRERGHPGERGQPIPRATPTTTRRRRRIPQQHGRGHVDLQRFDGGGDLPGLCHVAGQQEPGHQRSLHGCRRRQRSDERVGQPADIASHVRRRQRADRRRLQLVPAWRFHRVPNWSQRHGGGGSLQRAAPTATWKPTR